MKMHQWSSRLLTIAVALFIGIFAFGCASSETDSTEMTTTVTITPGEVTVPTEADPQALEQTDATDPQQTQPTEADMTQPAESQETKPAATEPAGNQQTQTTEPKQEQSTEPKQEQPQISKLDASQAQAVIQRVVGSLGVGTYNAGLSGGTAAELPVSAGLSTDAMAAALLFELREMVEEPEAGFSYSLAYRGVTADGASHNFVFTYLFETPAVPEPTLNTQAVVNQVTQNILADGSLGVTGFTASDYKTCISIRNVPHFYGDQEAIRYLTDAVTSKISSGNLMEKVYTEFRFVFDSKTETSYTFLLYLR